MKFFKLKSIVRMQTRGGWIATAIASPTGRDTEYVSGLGHTPLAAARWVKVMVMRDFALMVKKELMR